MTEVDLDPIDVLDRLVQSADQPDSVLRQVGEPQWANAGLVHDWRNYVPAAVRDVWSDLPLLAQVAAYLLAENRASAEEWD